MPWGARRCGVDAREPVYYGYNYRASPFQHNRRLRAAFTGGGSIFLFKFLFNGSWPFFRLMVYEDALEVRVMFHRFLVPFGKMDPAFMKLIGDRRREAGKDTTALATFWGGAVFAFALSTVRLWLVDSK